MIDGFRYGFLGNIRWFNKYWNDLFNNIKFFNVVYVAFYLYKKGYKIKS